MLGLLVLILMALLILGIVATLLMLTEDDWG